MGLVDRTIIAVRIGNRSMLSEFLTQEGSFVVDMGAEQVRVLHDLPRPFLEILMPCGERQVFYHDELPEKDIPCTCGDPHHWFIKYLQSGSIFDLPKQTFSPDFPLFGS